MPDDEIDEEPPEERQPGDDADELPELEFPPEYGGAKILQLEKCMQYFRDRVIPAYAIVARRVGRLYPHHQLPLKRWADELDEMARVVADFHRKTKLHLAAAKAARDAKKPAKPKRGGVR
jgi:hypothetical protein